MAFDAEIGTRPGWSRHSVAGREVWVAGYVLIGARTLTGADAAACLAALPTDPAALVKALRGLDGHFAAVVGAAGGVLWAATDVIASTPLFLSRTSGRAVVSDDPRRLATEPPSRCLDPEAALGLAISGFTTGPRTLHRHVARLSPGQVALPTADGAEVRSYRVYLPQPETESPARREARLADLLLGLFERLRDGASGRPIVVPLSAGLDSRLIVSALHHVGAKDVRCFAYGQPGNHEAIASRAIAEHLGLPWTFVPYSLDRQRAALASPAHDAYWDVAETWSATPFEQDFLAIRDLRASGWLPDEALLVNGQSGDFITGGHVPPALAAPLPGLTAEQRLDRVVDALVAKHYALWTSLHTADHLASLRQQVADDLAARGLAEVPEDMPHAAYELSEYDNRQAKYVVPGQRVYDFFGIDWRLPLWDAALVDFYATVPATDKLGQVLYRRVLESRNWGGVWQGWRTERTIVPGWIRPLRQAARAACAPLGRHRWHALERRLFAYHMDPLLNMAPQPWARVAADRRGYRNAISWITEAYLNRHGLRWDGRPRGDQP